MPITKQTTSVLGEQAAHCPGSVWDIFSAFFERGNDWSTDLLSLALTLVQFDQLPDGRRILRLFTPLSEGAQPGKAQRVARFCPDFSRRMVGRARDLVGQHFQDQ